nr:MAG TPA: hypothetical protein [Bacteriophage sp.]
MACLTLIGGDRNLSCGVPPAAELGRPVSAKILNASKIVSFTVSSGRPVATITRAAKTAALNIEAGNNSLVVNIAMKGGEVYPQQHDVSIEATLYNHQNENESTGRAYTGGMNGKYIIAVDHGNGVYKVYGLGAPLEVLSVEGSSTGNGFVRTTFGVEDWQVGTTIYNLTKEDYDALSTPAT